VTQKAKTGLLAVAIVLVLVALPTGILVASKLAKDRTQPSHRQESLAPSSTAGAKLGKNEQTPEVRSSTPAAPRKNEGTNASTEKPTKQAGAAVAASAIAWEKIIGHMTTESDTVIFFNDRGDVISTSEIQYMVGVQGYRKFIGVVPATAMQSPPMKGVVMFTWSADGIGNRYSRARATALLQDCIRLQSGPQPDPNKMFDDFMKAADRAIKEAPPGQPFIRPDDGGRLDVPAIVGDKGKKDRP
jgi:hypothetical protein